MNKKDRIHDWRKLKWPFTATFLYITFSSRSTPAPPSRAKEGFRHVPHGFDRGTPWHFSYCYFLCKKEEHAEARFTFHSAYVSHLHTAALHPLADDDGACDRRVAAFSEISSI